MSEVTISGDRIAWPDGADRLIREAAAGAPATKLCRAAFNAILNGELTTVSELADQQALRRKTWNSWSGVRWSSMTTAAWWRRTGCPRCRRDSIA